MTDSIRYKTYGNVVDTLKCIGEQHLEIKTTTTGDIWDIDLEKNTMFPLYHINPMTVDIGLQTKTFNFQLFVMDIVDADGDNEQYVLSDTLQIMNDILSILKHGETMYQYDAANGEEPRYWIGDDFSCEPFTERFDNQVSGWVMEIAVEVENELNSCNIPIDNTTICVK
tara:strand:- start:6805 stop:7311 length:507 start_codon:yes stop_codon:yes gene_type:complete